MLHLILLATTLQVSLTSCQDLKSIFHTPRRNYDDFEILERANFGGEDTATTPTTPVIDKPRAYANAQVMLRFGDGKEKGKCACGEECQCRQTIPYILPIFTPLPYCLCAPPTATPKPDDVQNENVVNEREQKKDNDNNNHPEILDTVDLSNEVIQPKEVKYLEEVSNKLEPSEVSPNVKFLKLDFSKAPQARKNDIVDLDKCLLPYSGPTRAAPKLLLTYPIFNRPASVKPPVEYHHSGYSLSEGSGYYADPVMTVLYRRPTVLTIIEERPKYVLVPVQEHGEDCECCSCAKYVGELNEKAT